MAFDLEAWKAKREFRKLMDRSSLSYDNTHGYCSKCGKDQVKLPGATCAECGSRYMKPARASVAERLRW